MFTKCLIRHRSMCIADATKDKKTYKGPTFLLKYPTTIVMPQCLYIPYCLKFFLFGYFIFCAASKHVHTHLDIYSDSGSF